MLKSYEARTFPDGTKLVKVRLTNNAMLAKRTLAEYVGLIGPKAALVKDEKRDAGIIIILEARVGSQTPYPDEGFPAEG